MTPSSEPYCSMSFAAVFGPTLSTPGTFVNRIAHERQVVDDSLRQHTDLPLTPRRVELVARHGVHPRDALVDELA
jgi:hypothetical protein